MAPRTYLSRLESAYQGEVYGEAMYFVIAAAQADPERAWKWRVLAEQEAELKRAMRGLVASHGGDTGESPVSRERGRADGERYAALGWNELMRRFSDALDEDIAEYADLERGCPPGDAETLKRLTLHEVLTKEFCELELAGRGNVSVDRIVDALERPPLR